MRIYTKNNYYNTLDDKLIYQNYHKHSMYTNPIIIDSCTYPEEYAVRAERLGHTILSSCEHGYQGRYIEYYELTQTCLNFNKNDEQCKNCNQKIGSCNRSSKPLKFLFAVEAYFVFDRFEKDNTNAHMVIVAKNENGRKAINRILSEANMTGYYYRARIDYDLLMSLPEDDVWITTACLGGINRYNKDNNKSERLIQLWNECSQYNSSYELLVDKIHQKFGDNFYLEVQAHNTPQQKELNQQIIELSNKYQVEIIAGVDSHYIYEADAWKRDYLQKSSGIFMEDEQGWFMDYPDGNTLFQRFKNQGVLTDDEILVAMNNTNVFLNVEEYDSPIFNYEMKMPSAQKYKYYTKEEKERELIKIVKNRWDEVKDTIPEEEHSHYLREIAKELDIIFKINHADYFLANYEIIKDAVENRDGMITFSGRGCAIQGVLIPTETTLKTIENVKKGDKVISSDGQFHQVLETFKYDIEEELIQIIHEYGTNTYHPLIYTTDHKILTYRDNKNQWISAECLTDKDYVCVPKIKLQDNTEEYIDLNKYNIYGFDYDDEYIYEYNSNVGKSYKYSPSDVARHIGCGSSLIENLANGNINNIGQKNKELKDKFFKYVPFETFEEYQKYIKNIRTKKIKRFIKNDYNYNVFIGLLYGDGCHREDKHTISLAINSITEKDKINRSYFEQFCNYMGFDIYELKSKNRKLIQLYFTSLLYSEYMKQELFSSKKDKEKMFNPKLFYQNKINLKGLKYGLWLADGSDKDGRITFDNTSMSLINAYKILSMICEDCGICHITKRSEHIDNRGYHNKTSYKVRYPKDPFITGRGHHAILQDEQFWYLKVKEIKKLPRQKISVYDIAVKDTHNYLANNMIAHNSGPSFYVNHLLGFTQIDRISSPITLYPERFLSTSRMSAGSLADIDFNCGNTPVFEESQKLIMGENNASPMIAYGTQKPKAAWKMFCRAVDVPFEVANEISAKINEYETDLKYWDEDSGEEKPDVHDYIPEDLREYFDQSKEFLGIISSASRHPCFTGETLVNTENGYKQIKDITVGEKVLSHDGKYRKVLKIMKRDITEHLLKFVTYEDISFIVTQNHPILTDVSAIYDFESKLEFMPAMLFKTGDKLFSPHCGRYCIKKIQKIKFDNITQVYNLNVDVTNTYTVTTNDIIVHNCGNILYTEDIREEFGIVRLRSKGGKETIVACCDGGWIEKHLMLKNDLLTVACVKLNYLLYERIGIPYMSLNKLLEECKEHPEVWTMYEKGYVIGLNQVEKNSTKRKVMKYKPKNISELSAFIAGIRPAFKSLLDKLINREHFEYGIPTLDKLLQTEELPESFILYQEQIMKILAFAGIPMGDCYTVIKSISKKRFAKIMHYKKKFLNGMAKKLIEEEQVSEERANEVAHTIWGIIEDASAYGFNSSHSLSVSFDSLLAAYFKALYSLEFYEVYLNLQMERSDKAKALLATKEMKEAFNINLLPMRFGQDNRKYTAYKETNSLSNCLKSIKGFGDIVGSELYRLSRHKFDNFLDLLVAKVDYVNLYPIEVWDDYISEHIVSQNYDDEIRKCLNIYMQEQDNSEFLINGKKMTLENVFLLSEIEDLYDIFELSKSLWKIKVNDSQMETLIMLNYFDNFGNNDKLLKEFKMFCDYYGRVQINKDKINDLNLDVDVFMKYVGKETKSLYKDIDFVGYIKEISKVIPDKYVSLPKQLKFERELLEIPIYQNKKLPSTWYYVLGFKTYGDRINSPYLILYNLTDASIINCQINKSKMFRDEPFGIYSIINVQGFEDIPRKKKVGEKQFVTTNELKTIIKGYEVIFRDQNEEINEVINNGY